MAWDFAARDPIIQMAMALMNAPLSREQFIAQKDHYRIVTFDPTDQPCLLPVKADLRWLLPALSAAFGLGWLIGRWAWHRSRQGLMKVDRVVCLVIMLAWASTAALANIGSVIRRPLAGKGEQGRRRQRLRLPRVLPLA